MIRAIGDPSAEGETRDHESALAQISILHGRHRCCFAVLLLCVVLRELLCCVCLSGSAWCNSSPVLLAAVGHLYLTCEKSVVAVVV